MVVTVMIKYHQKVFVAGQGGPQSLSNINVNTIYVVPFNVDIIQIKGGQGLCTITVCGVVGQDLVSSSTGFVSKTVYG